MIEAGDRNAHWLIHMPGGFAIGREGSNWKFETEPQAGLNGRRGYQPRGRGLGGSSAINAMLYLRGHPWDYDNWAAMGCDGWGWDDVLPIFRRAECNERGADAWHGDAGPLHVSDQRFAHAGSRAFVEAAARLQHPRNDDFNGERQDGFGLYQVTQRKGERWTAARAYLGDGRPPANLNLVTDATVDRVIFEDGRAVGVHYYRGGRLHFLRAREGVVLAGGVFGTPQTLMLSGIGDPAHLAEHGVETRVARPAVGTNLQDHVDYVAVFEADDTSFFGTSLKGNVAAARAIWRWMRRREGTFTTPFAESGGFWRTDPAQPAPDVQYHFVIAMLEDHGRTKLPGHGYSGHVCVLRPYSHGTVRLGSSDARAAPRIDPAFLSDPRDMETLKRGVRELYRIMETPPMADYRGRDRYPVDLRDDAALEALIRQRADTIYHPVGTARMGSDDDAVCDPKLRVRGVDRLWVADASIMPKLVSGNTNAPSMMIGERAADFIRADIGG